MQTVESNPMLELEENDHIDDEDDQPPIEDDPDLFEDSAESRAANGEAVDDPSDMTDIPDELAVDVSWEDIYEPAASGAGPARTEFADSGFEERNGAGTSLREDLLWQLNLAPLSDRMRLAAFVVVDSIDEDGMLLASIDDLLAALDAELGFDAAEMEAAVQAVQRFDPPGVGARDLSNVCCCNCNGCRPRHLGAPRRQSWSAAICRCSPAATTARAVAQDKALAR